MVTCMCEREPLQPPEQKALFSLKRKVNSVERSMMGVLPGLRCGLHQHKLGNILPHCVQGTQDGISLRRAQAKTLAHLIEAGRAAGRPEGG